MARPQRCLWIEDSRGGIVKASHPFQSLVSIPKHFIVELERECSRPDCEFDPTKVDAVVPSGHCRVAVTGVSKSFRELTRGCHNCASFYVVKSGLAWKPSKSDRGNPTDRSS
jgi:hypothetical protein